MPYAIVKQGDQFCVRNTDTGTIKPGRCHETRAKAAAQMRLLYSVEKGTFPGTGPSATVVDKKVK